MSKVFAYLYHNYMPVFSDDPPPKPEHLVMVARIEFKDPAPTDIYMCNQVFHMTQHIDEPWCAARIKDTMLTIRSTSVGDVVVIKRNEQTKNTYQVLGMGWRQLSIDIESEHKAIKDRLLKAHFGHKEAN